MALKCYRSVHKPESTILATPNYGFEKRQKELAKKKKKEEKLKQKQAEKEAGKLGTATDGAEPDDDAETTTERPPQP